MAKICITQNGEVLARHSTETCLSHYGRPVWIIENSDPGPGPAIFEEAESGTRFEMEIIGVVGGWLVVRQPATDQAPALLAGIIWSDGNYHGELIQTRDGKNLVEDATIEDLAGGNFMVGGTVTAGPFDEVSPLGSVLS